jgi:hypothetical protein
VCKWMMQLGVRLLVARGERRNAGGLHHRLSGMLHSNKSHLWRELKAVTRVELVQFHLFHFRAL